MKQTSFAILLVALWVVVLIILLTPEIPNGHGFGHAKFMAMDQGGDGAQRHESFLLTGWIFGSVLIGLFVSLLVWGTVGQPLQAGASEPAVRRRPDGRVWAFLLSGLLYEGVFAGMCLAYRKSLADPEVAFQGPFPAGVSWLLFGLWLIPVCFVALYVVFFSRWIAPPENLEKFAELVPQPLIVSAPKPKFH